MMSWEDIFRASLADYAKALTECMDVIEAGRCHPACMMAFRTSSCGCTCHGDWHGAMSYYLDEFARFVPNCLEIL